MFKAKWVKRVHSHRCWKDNSVIKWVYHDQDQGIPKSSTTLALLSTIHHWTMMTDGTGALVSVVVFDYRRVFDLIDHHIILKLDIPRGVLCWVLDILSSWKQHVKLESVCLSERGQVPAGISQGTKLGPWLFLLMINDLNIPDMSMWKYVNDTTSVEITHCGEVSHAQSADKCSYWGGH